MTYNDIHDAIVIFLQEFKKEIKKEHDYVVNHVTNTNNAHTLENVDSLKAKGQTIKFNIDSDDPLSDAADELLKTLIKLCEEQYVHPLTHSADMIESNPGRRFVTDNQLVEFSNKVGESYVDNSIDKLHKDIEIEISNKLENIINMPKVTNNLEAINAILDSQETLFNLISLCSSKIGKDEFEKHENNGKHLTDDEYNAIKLIIEFINNGGIDWNAKTDDGLQAIKNRPDKLPADGGNADSVSGRKINALLDGRRTSTIIIGKDGYGYTKDMCDYWCNGINDAEMIQKAVDSLSNTMGGEIYIREGEYNITNDLKLERADAVKGSIIIKGCGNATILKAYNCSIDISNNIEINRLCIDYACITMCNGVEFNDSRLENCNVKIIKAMSSINNSDIITSTISFGDSSINNMVANNRFIKSALPLFNGNNFVKCNYEIK